MTFSIDNPSELQQPPPPLGKYVWENPQDNKGYSLLMIPCENTP